jgi:aminoglycoside phosphotransferase (APT) family kinase protein
MAGETPYMPSAAMLARLLRESGIEEPLVRCNKHTGGYSHLVYDLNDRYILRCSAHPESATAFAREAAVLNRLRANEGVARVLGSGSFGPLQDWHYLLVTKFPGDNVFRLWLDESRELRDRYVQELVNLIRPVHATVASRYTFGFYQTAISVPGASWMEGHDEYFATVLEGARRRDLSPELSRLITDADGYYQSHRGSLAHAVGPRLTHGDLHLYNVIAEHGHVTGLIDWEWAHGSEPDCDLAHLVRWALYPWHPAEEELEAAATRELFGPIIPELLDAYSELAAIPRLLERMTIYELEHDLHQIALGATEQPQARLHGWLRDRILDPFFG